MSVNYLQIRDAYQNALANQIWDPTSYAMSNELEYFAEGTGVFFNTNNHPDSSGGMNRSYTRTHLCTKQKREMERQIYTREQDTNSHTNISINITHKC